MTADELIEQIKNKRKEHLVIFSADGDWCRWCNALQEILQRDTILQKHLEENNIVLHKFKLDRKETDQTEARERFPIKSLPTLILFDQTGEILGHTEYLDDAQEQGTKAYANWVTETRGEHGKLNW